MIRLSLHFILIFAMTAAVSPSAPPATQPADQEPSLERRLRQTLSGAEFIGRFTVDDSDGPLKEDHYSLGEVKHLHGNLWLIPAKIGHAESFLPLVAPIEWAGDAPVISVTDFGVPGMGSYTARVVIYSDHYAGTWTANAKHQGTLFGKIVRAATTQPRGQEN